MAQWPFNEGGADCPPKQKQQSQSAQGLSVLQ